MHLKIPVGVVIVFTTISAMFYFYHRRPLFVKLVLDKTPLSKKDLEYYRGLPKRLAANYYPQKETHGDVLVGPNFPSENSSKVIVTFLVKSEARNLQRRKVIRGTWGSIKTYQSAIIHTVFVIGTDSEHEVRLKGEVDKLKDIIQVNVTDKFSNQPKKMLSAFHWIVESKGLISEFFVTTEDNCVVNIATTLEFLLKHQSEVRDSIHCGYMFEKHAGVIRGHGIRSISTKVYSARTYPAFCRGQLVLFDFSFMEKIYHASTVTNITGFHLDDVLLYGILRDKLGIENSIKNVLNGGISLVFYPWDDTEKAIFKMMRKWEQWKVDTNNSTTTSPK